VLHPVSDLATAKAMYAAKLAEVTAAGATVKEPVRDVDGWLV
jgi:hypothetical protein